MGNLELNPSHIKSFERKPIFLTPNSMKGQSLCRSLSPYMENTNRSSINRSMINKSSMKNSFVSRLSYHDNRVYINPKMIKSVIKNTTTNSSLAKSNTSRLIKPKLNLDDSSMMSLGKSPRNIVHSPIFKQRYTEKPFQSSPIKTRVPYKDPDQSSFYKEQKQNLSLIIEQNSATPKMKYSRGIANQFVKQPSNSSKILKLDTNAVKGYYNEDKTLSSCKHACCCHRVGPTRNINQDEQMINELDNFPTERKRTQKKFETQKQFTLDLQYQNSKKKKKKIQESDEESTIFHKNKINPNIIHNQNRQKCQQIIKRVRNFNEFLNQVKNKIKKQADSASSYNNTIDNISFTEHQSFNHASPNTSIDQFNHNSAGQSFQSHSRSITLALKLENERIQLQKYRKLVQRQLSKQHSIQSIQIDSTNKEKIITINFQKKPKKEEAQKINKEPEQIQKINQQQQVQMPPLKPLKQNEPIQTKKQNEKQQNSEVKQKNDIGKRLNNINKLFNKMQGMNKIQTQTHRQILQILKNEPDIDQPEQEDSK